MIKLKLIVSLTSFLPFFVISNRKMDLALDITSACRVRVLLVPVSPIKKSTFWHHVELVRKFSLVRLGDVTPDLHQGANGKSLLHTNVQKH